MRRIYKAILHKDHIEWLDGPPVPARPVPVYITLLEDTTTEPSVPRGQAMARALEALAQAGGLSVIADPVAWQRKMREDRALPGR
jgi:hypothetical protein